MESVVTRWLLFLVFPCLLCASGDRHPDTHCVYPDEAFFHNGQGGSILDITKAPFNARGDGKTDDTQAFVRAYDFILREQDKVGYAGAAMLNTKGLYPNNEGYPSDGLVKTRDSSFIIYLPEGDYLVSDTIIYSMPDRTPSKKRDRFFKGGQWRLGSTGWERLIWVRFVGESRERTVIRLKDKAKGFGRGAEKPVISFGKSPFNNRKGMNAVRNLTIDVGRGNPGAIGIDFTSANKAQLRNLTIRSSDGAGDTGILFKRPPVIGYHSDITIEGFDYGISSRVGHACAPVFEYLSLSGQNKAGVLLAKKRPEDGGKGEAMLALRFLKSKNQVPAVKLAVEGGHLILTDSILEGLDDANASIDAEAGAYFLRNLQTPGYKWTVRGKVGPKVKGPFVDENVSGQVFCSAGQVPKSLNLDVPSMDPPDWPEGPADWATPFQYGARADGSHDDTKAVQAAFNSGKPVVFLTQARYKLTAPIQVPETVRFVDGLFRYNPDLELVVGGDSSIPVRISDFYRGSILQDGPRPVLLEVADATYRNTSRAAGGRLFVLNGSYPWSRWNPASIDFYGWSVNNEGHGLPLVNDGATVWMFGFKCERGPVLHNRNGAIMEILGATIGVSTPDKGAIVNSESSLSLVANKSAGAWTPDAVAIEQTFDGQTTLFRVRQLPPRTKTHPEFPLIPLYVGRNPD